MGKYKKIQVSVKILKNPLHFFALGFGTGLLTKAPGTMGTLVGVLIYILLPSNNLILYFAIIISFFIFGIQAFAAERPIQSPPYVNEKKV